MYLAVVAIHVVLSLLLVVVILVQPGKGGDVGAAFGGAGSSTLFGPRGPSSIFARATTVIAVGFMVTSITLALYSNREILAGSNVLDELQRRSEQRTQPTGATAPSDAPPVEQPAPVELELVPEEAAPEGAGPEEPPAPQDEPATP